MSKIKRFLTGTLIAVLLLGTAACGRQEAAPAAPEVTEPQQTTGEAIPTVDRQAQLADAKEKTPTPPRGCTYPAWRWTIP